MILTIITCRTPNQHNNITTSQHNNITTICKANRLGFLPIVFESNGFLHRKSVDFFHQVAENCAVDKGISTEIIFNYFLKGLSFSLQKSIAHSIQFKLSNRCSVNSAFNANAILLAAETHV